MTPNSMQVIERPSPYPKLVTVARIVLWLVIFTASTKPSEVFGLGEQSWGATSFADVAFRALVLLACAFAVGVAAVNDRIRSSSLIFVPFLLWAFTVAVLRQADLTSAKQIGSYASWILFYIAATALLDRPGDYPKLAAVLVGSVVLSALGGEIQHLLGYGPALGTRWPDAADSEFMRTHTGSGGILLDAFTPYCAAMLLLSLPASKKRQMLAWVLALWGTANILRGGLLAFVIALIWYLLRAPKASRRQILASLSIAALIGVFLFGGAIKSKITGESDEGVNTSGRLDVWPVLTQAIAEEPLAGHGPDEDIQLLAQSAAGHDIRGAHNELLSTGVNFGLIGVFLLWAALLVLLGRGVVQTLRASSPAQSFLSASTGVLIMVVVLSLTDNTLRTPGVMILALAPATITGAVRRHSQAPAFLQEYAAAMSGAEVEPC